MTSKTLPTGTGVVSSYTYDNAGRLTGISHVKGGSTTLASVSYTLDDVDNRTQRVDQQGTHTYAYDDVYRLTSVTYPGPATTSYTFDAFGNRLTKTDAGGTTNYTYDDADRLTSVDPPGAPPAVTYTWDNNGNLTNRGSDTFAWDYEDRMTSATVSVTTTTFAYRGDGLRNSRTTGGNTTTFTWDIAAGLPVVIDDGKQYVYGAGLEQMVASGSRYYYLADGLGSTMAMVDSTGTVQKSYSYDVYGKPTATGTLPNEFDFAGQQTDATGLQYLRARYMDPETGSFSSREPIGVLPMWSTTMFGYAEQSPTMATDPTGTICLATKSICEKTNKVVDKGKDKFDDIVDSGIVKKAMPAATQCIIWGAGGLVVGGPGGGAVGCAAGAASQIVADYLKWKPLGQCVVWGAAGSKAGGAGGAVIGCAAGLADHYLSAEGSACTIWAVAGALVDARKGFAAGTRSFIAGCWAGGVGDAAARGFAGSGTSGESAPEKPRESN